MQDKLKIELTQDSAKQFIKYYQNEIESIKWILNYDNKQLKWWMQNEDKQLITYQKQQISKRQQKIKIYQTKINFLKKNISQNNTMFSFELPASEFLEIKYEYLHYLHCKYNEQFVDKKRDNTINILEDFKNREFFNQPLPEKTKIPFCATDLYTDNVPKSLINCIGKFGEPKMLEVILDEENTKKALKIKEDELSKALNKPAQNPQQKTR